MSHKIMLEITFQTFQSCCVIFPYTTVCLTSFTFIYKPSISHALSLTLMRKLPCLPCRLSIHNNNDSITFLIYKQQILTKVAAKHHTSYWKQGTARDKLSHFTSSIRNSIHSQKFSNICKIVLRFTVSLCVFIYMLKSQIHMERQHAAHHEHV